VIRKTDLKTGSSGRIVGYEVMCVKCSLKITSYEPDDAADADGKWSAAPLLHNGKGVYNLKVIPRTSHLTHNTSHTTPHTQHLTPHTSPAAGHARLRRASREQRAEDVAVGQAQPHGQQQGRAVRQPLASGQMVRVACGV
jgi:hypothetical protein